MDDNRLENKPVEEENQLPEIELPGTEPLQENEDTRTDLQKKVAALSAATWKKIMIPSGIAVGVAVLYFLYASSGEESGGLFSTSSLIALLVALLLPNYAEKTCDRSVNTGRLAMLLTIAIGLVFQVLRIGMQTGFKLTN